MVPSNPFATDAGCKTEGCAWDAHQHVTDADVQEKHVDWVTKGFKLAEEDEDNQVIQETKKQD